MNSISDPLALWRARTGPEWCAVYWDSTSLRHRTLIVEALKSLPPWRVLTELGSHCGPNLRVIHEVFPQALLWGVDANNEAVDYGRMRMALTSAALCKAIDLTCAPIEVDWIERMRCDVVLTSYVLTYLAPDVLPGVLRAMAQAALVGVVLAEPSVKQRGAVLGAGEIPEHYHDWDVLIADAFPGAAVTLLPVEPSVDRLDQVLVVQGWRRRSVVNR